MSSWRRALHLVRRWRSSLRPRPLNAVERAHVAEVLGGQALQAWQSMPLCDQRHALDVAARFAQLRPHATTAERAGALLHDVGKADLRMGTMWRVAATVVGPRGRPGSRLRAYHAHEARGAAMLAARGVDAATVELVAGHGPAAAALRAADDI